MERDLKEQRTKKIKAMKTLENNKRTISSEHAYCHPRNGRKYTLENQQTKKNLYKNTSISRKNQSLPKALTAIGMYNSAKSQRQQKRIGSVTQIRLSQLPKTDKVLFNEFDLSKYTNQNNIKLSLIMQQGQQLFCNSQFKQSKLKFEEVISIVKEKFPKANYLLGISEYRLDNYNNAIMALSRALDAGYEFATDGFLALAQSYDKTRNYICAKKILDEWIKVESNEISYLMRARILFSFKEFQKSIDDYRTCYELNPQKLQAYIEEAEVTYLLDGLHPALEKYNQLLVNYKNIWPEYKYIDINYVKYKKSLLLIQQRKYDNALILLQQVSNPELQSQVNYYIGIIQLMLKDSQQAVVCFSKSIEANTSAKFVSQSYYQKFVLMFKQNNFYAIQHELDLIDSQFPQSEPLQMFEILIKGIISVLKMNFKAGIALLNQITSQNQYYISHKHIQKPFKNTIIAFKSFSYYSIHEFDKALKQLETLPQKNIIKSETNLYNLTMLRGILQCLNGDYTDSFKNFELAEQIQPFNNHTFMMKALAEILFFRSLESVRDREGKKPGVLQQNKKKRTKQSAPSENKRKSMKKYSGTEKQKQKSEEPGNKNCCLNLSEAQFSNQEILLSAEQLMNRCLLKEPENDQILYILATLYYELQQYQTGLKYIRKAIEVSDDHMIKHYYVKANLKVMLGLTNEAISDYSNALLVMSEQDGLDKDDQSIQQKIMDVYLERAKCYIKQNMKEKAENDLKVFFNNLEIVRKFESDLELFMHVGCSDIILDIYQNVLNKQQNVYEKMKCFYLSKQLNNCLTTMNTLLDFQSDQEDEKNKDYNVEELIIDRNCLEALRRSSQNSELLMKEALKVFQKILNSGKYGNIFQKSDCMFFAGVLSFYLGDHCKAKNYFIDSKGEKLLKDNMTQNFELEEAFQNRTYCLEEINYNIGVCDFIQGKWSQYLDEYSDFKQLPENISNQEITPFPIKNRLCSIYPAQNSRGLTYRLSFCLPELKLKEVTFKKKAMILQRISLKDIDMRPSAPWIKKSKKGIMFTGEIAKQSVDLKSQMSKNNVNNKKSQNRYREEQF